MGIVDDIRPITYLKARAPELLRQLNETHRPVIITQNGEPKAVMLDPESYENMRAALGILKLLAQAEDDIAKGKVRSQEDVFGDLEKRLEARIQRKMKKKYDVHWTEVAEQDLVQIIDYIANDNPRSALDVLKKIQGKAALLCNCPERGRVVPELCDQGIEKYRKLIIPPWRVMFRISKKSVYVLSVIDARRNIEDILLRRLLDKRI